MKLIRSIASYTGNSRKNMEQILNEKVKEIIVKIAENPELKQAAHLVNIDIEDKFSVITYEQSKEYQSYIDKISNVCSNYYFGKMSYIESALLSTTSGKSGAPIKNMMMNFWRYMRKSIAKKLYEDRFLTDRIPLDGSFTIFYENNVGYFNWRRNGLLNKH